MEIRPERVPETPMASLVSVTTNVHNGETASRPSFVTLKLTFSSSGHEE